MLVLDGEQWKLAVTYSDGTVFRSGGSNAYPDNWQQLLDFFGIVPSNQEEDPDDTNPSLVAAPGPEGLRASIEELRNELANQVLERDQLLYVTCRNIEMAYMLEIGGLEYRAYELECAVERLKRKMELLQAQKNRQEQIDLAAVEEILDMQLARYQAKLKEKIAKMNQAIEWGRKTPLT